MDKIKTRLELRKTARVSLGICGLMSGFFFWRGNAACGVFFSALFLLLGLAPLALGPKGEIPLRAWLAITEAVGLALSRALLGLVFFGVITPVAWAMRIVGRDRLGLKRPKAASTYWKTLEPNPSRYTRQF